MTEASTEPRKFPQHRFAPPPGACEILMLRHGESAPHVEGEEFPLVDGHGDPALSPEGRVQAEQAADRLIATGERISAIYVTTLQRTHQTAAPLAARLGLEPIVEPELREVFLGDWEGGEVRKRLADGDPIALKMAVTAALGRDPRCRTRGDVRRAGATSASSASPPHTRTNWSSRWSTVA